MSESQALTEFDMVTVQGQIGLSPSQSETVTSYTVSAAAADLSHAKWLKRRVFTQGCAFCGKSPYFSYPLISRVPNRSKFRKFLDLEIFRSIWPLTLEVTERTPLILHRSSMKVT